MLRTQTSFPSLQPDPPSHGSPGHVVFAQYGMRKGQLGPTASPAGGWPRTPREGREGDIVLCFSGPTRCLWSLCVGDRGYVVPALQLTLLRSWRNAPSHLLDTDSPAGLNRCRMNLLGLPQLCYVTARESTGLSRNQIHLGAATNFPARHYPFEQ
jgi:hypothetical protein